MREISTKKSIKLSSGRSYFKTFFFFKEKYHQGRRYFEKVFSFQGKVSSLGFAIPVQNDNPGNPGFFSKFPGNSRDLLKINFINHLDRDTRGPNPY